MGLLIKERATMYHRYHYFDGLTFFGGDLEICPFFTLWFLFGIGFDSMEFSSMNYRVKLMHTIHPNKVYKLMKFTVFEATICSSFIFDPI